MKRVVVLAVAFAIPWLVAAMVVANWLQPAYRAQEPRVYSSPPLPNAAAAVEMNVEGVVVVVTVDVANVRGGPSIAASSIAQLAYGTELQVLGQQKDWYRVRLPDCREGYVAAGWVVEAEREGLELRTSPTVEPECPTIEPPCPSSRPTPSPRPPFEYPFYRIPIPGNIDPGIQPQWPREWRGDDGILPVRGYTTTATAKGEWIVGAGR